MEKTLQNYASLLFFTIKYVLEPCNLMKFNLPLYLEFQHLKLWRTKQTYETQH